MEKDETIAGNKNCVRRGNSSSRYTFSEDMAIVNYITTENRYLRSAGIQVWKDAEKLQICPGRPYLSMKERFRKTIIKNLKQYNVDKDVIAKVMQFMKADPKGKTQIRLKCS